MQNNAKFYSMLNFEQNGHVLKMENAKNHTAEIWALIQAIFPPANRMNKEGCETLGPLAKSGRHMPKPIPSLGRSEK